MCNIQQTKSKYLIEYKSAILLAIMNASSQLEQIYGSKASAKQLVVEMPLRKELISWIAEVSKHLGVTPKHTQSVVMLIDIVLFSEHVETNNYQLLGITCFHMVSKYLGEAEQVKITDFLAAASHAYSTKDVLRLELHLASKYLMVFSKSFAAFDIQQILVSELRSKSSVEEGRENFLARLMMFYFLRVSPLKCNVLASAAALIVFLELSNDKKAVSKVLLSTFMLSRLPQAQIMAELAEVRKEMMECASLLSQSDNICEAVESLRIVPLEQYLCISNGQFIGMGEKFIEMNVQSDSFMTEY